MRHCNASPLLLLALLLVGCKGSVHASESQGAGGIGPPDDPSSVDYVSGARLRAQVYVSDSGARKFHGWYDSKTRQACVFQEATDGRMRCLPRARSDEAYIDDACTQRVIYGEGDLGSAPVFYSDQAPGACAASVHALGPAIKAETIYWKLASGCQQYKSLGASGTARVFGPPVDPKEFVGASMVRESRGSQLAMQFLDAEDGARQATEPYDFHHGASCNELGPNVLKQPNDLCVPSREGFPGEKYFDAECTQAVAAIARCPHGQDEQSYAWAMELQSCHPSVLQGVLPMGELLSNPPYEMSNGHCQQSWSADTVKYAMIGDLVPIDSLRGIRHTHDPSGVVVAEWLVSTDLQRLRVDDFYDTKAGARCTPMLASDCKTRCLPRVPNRFRYALDAMCTKHVIISDPKIDCDVVPPPVVIVTEGTKHCTGAFARVFKTGQALSTPSVVYAGSDCAASTSGSSVVLFEATEIPPSQFPEIMDATE